VVSTRAVSGSSSSARCSIRWAARFPWPSCPHCLGVGPAASAGSSWCPSCGRPGGLAAARPTYASVPNAPPSRFATRLGDDVQRSLSLDHEDDFLDLKWPELRRFDELAGALGYRMPLAPPPRGLALWSSTTLDERWRTGVWEDLRASEI